MWLGLSAMLTALSFALVKFLTALHMRRMEDDRVRLQYELKRGRQLVDSLQGKWQISQANLGSAQSKVETARRFRDDLRRRLTMELPTEMQTQLDQCLSRHPVPEPRGMKIFHQLHISDRIAAALGAVSIIVLDLPDDGGPAQATLIGELVQVMENGGVSYTRTERRDEDDAERIVCGFDSPDAAMHMVRELARVSSAERLVHLRGILMSAVSVSDDEGDNLTLSFARSLDLAQHLLTSATMGTLLLNEPAFAALSDRTGIEEFSPAEKLYAYDWRIDAPPPSEETGETEADESSDEDKPIDEAEPQT